MDEHCLHRLTHRLMYRQAVMHKDGIGTFMVCSDRALGRVRHAAFYPDLDPPVRHPVPVERISELLDAQSAAEVIRRLTSAK
jgi:hypothetical protein